MEQLKRKLANNADKHMTQLQSHPIAVTPRHATPVASPKAAARLPDRTAGFSHSRILPKALMDAPVRYC